MATDTNYQTIDRPFDAFMQRSGTSDSAVGTMGAASGMSVGAGVEGGLTDLSSAGSNATTPGYNNVIQSGNIFKDVWMSTWIKSQDYLPKSRGFLIDARTGYIECMSLFVTGDAVFDGVTLTGGDINFGKTSFLDSVNAGYWIGPEGIYIGAANDTSKMKFDIAGNSFTVGGWTIGQSTLSSTGVTLSSSGNASIAFGIVPPTSPSLGTGIYMDKTGLFGLSSNTQNFKIDATNGNITAIAGTVGGWSITPTTLSATGIILDTVTQSITVGNSTPDIVINGIGKFIRTSSYVSGAQGFSLEGLTGNAEFNNLFARGEFHTQVLSYGSVHVTAGSELLALSGGTLKSDLTTVASPTTFNIDVNDPPVGHIQMFSAGDILRIKDGSGNDNWMRVLAVAGQTTDIALEGTDDLLLETGDMILLETGDLILAESGDILAENSDFLVTEGNPYFSFNCVLLNGTPATFYAGAAIADYGQTGQGLIFSTVDSLHSPYIGVQTHAGSPWTAINERVRMGNLNGYLDYATDIYGFAVGDTTGNLANLTIDPVNGIRMRNGTTPKFTIDNAGNATFAGALSAATGTFAGSLSAATGTFAGSLSAATGTFSGALSAASGTFAGTINAVSGSFKTVVLDPGGSLSLGQSDYDSGTGFWLGDKSGTAKFSIGNSSGNKMTWDGSVLSINGQISGRASSTIASAIDTSANLVTNVVNTALNTSSKSILADFNFGATNYAGAVNAGDITWNSATGTVTGGSGVILYRKGIVGVNAGITTFSIDATTGAAAFGGTLTAPSGTIGGFTIGASTLSATNLTLTSGVANTANIQVGTGSNLAGMNSANAGSDIAFWAGSTYANRATAPFRVTAAGDTNVTSVTIQNSTDVVTGTAGETLSPGHSVYFKASDSKLYKTDTAGDESTFSFVGVIVTGGSADSTVTYASVGSRATAGLTLTPGSYYYLSSSAGAMSTTPDATRYARVGFALSTTAMRVIEPSFYRSGNYSFSGTGNTTVTTGFYPAHIALRGFENFAGCSASWGNETNTCFENFVGTGAAGVWTKSATKAFYLTNPLAGGATTGTISSITSTGFVVNCDNDAEGGGHTYQIYWEVWS